ncbi:putative Eisosome protein 1 [Rhexocercosporidium sp. MPI-PUGE-AT-0058]|nr:putative Eisosome protein 1 [Rhexocercosporidium sp. MPI-PUGE-AT-0058]
MAQTSTAAVPTGPIQDASRPATSSTRLEDQAALAALYVTRYDNNQNSSKKNGQDFLDKDNKLSSAGAAASLKYANPQDLPSFPSTGLKKNDSSAAGAAASLGWANQKSFEHWKPDPSASASAAAMQAHDYKMAPLWQPEASAHGAKAALLAHRDGGKVEIWKPEAKSAWGHSAATQAMASHRQGGLSPQLDYGHTDLGRKGSLLAATGAMASSRKRAQSIPTVSPQPDTYPDESNAASNALRAATSASRASRRSDMPEAGAVPITNMSREMYTAAPPVQPEVDEKNRQDTLRASAVAMAQSMYQYQQKQFDAATHAQRGASAAHRRNSSLDSADNAAQPMRFNNLQEAAQKLAQERLAKLHDEHAQNREYRDYYSSNTSAPQSRLSLRGRNRNRASSLGTFEDDKEQSNKIRAQMSQFSSNLSQVDEKKRQQDRENLIAAAQRNVTKSLHGMDEKVFADTGKIAPSLLNEWEVKAHAAAQANSDTRMENHGKVHIGGGKFINQSEINLVAARNVQPVLDEINEKAEAERERQAALKAEQETQQRKAAEKKAREKEQKEIEKKLRQQDKEEKKIERQDEKLAAKEKRKSLKTEGGGIGGFLPGSKKDTAGTAAATESTERPNELAPEYREEPTIAERRESAAPTPIRTSMEDQASLRMRETVAAANGEEVTPMSASSESPRDSKVKNWLKTKFSRRMSKGQKSPGLEKENSAGSGFIGGAALTGASANNSTASLGAKSSSVREVATAGTGTSSVVPASTSTAEPAVDHYGMETLAKSPTTIESDPELEADSDTESDLYSEPNTVTAPEPANAREPVAAAAPVQTAEPTKAAVARTETEERGRPVSKISTVSSMGREDDDEFQEARDNFDEDLAPPSTFPAEKSTSPARTGKFHEEI